MNPYSSNLSKLKDELTAVAANDIHRFRQVGTEACRLLQNIVEQVSVYNPHEIPTPQELVEVIQEMENISEASAQQMRTDLLFVIELCLHTLDQDRPTDWGE